MAWITFDHQVKYNGKFYKAGEKIKTDDSEDSAEMGEIPEMDGAEEGKPLPRRGRPKGSTRQDAVLEWEEE